MIKLTDLLKEEETFTATSKKSGETAVFKTKDARDAAVKAGTHSKIKDSEDGDDKKDTPKVNIFDKPKKDEPKKDEPVRDDQTDAQIEDVQNNIDDMPGDEIQDYAESDIFPYLKGKDLETAKMFVDDIEDSGSDFVRSADVRADLKDLFDKKMSLENTSTNLRDLLPESIINEGTRSQVGVIGRNGKIVSAYVHYDGYPSNMKPGLKHHMKSDKDVLKLIKMGGARGIFDDKEIEYYKNGKPTKGDMKDFGKYVDTADRSGGAEYIYLYNMKDKKWYFADVYGDKKLKKLF
jgi:hypothetical protein